MNIEFGQYQFNIAKKNGRDHIFDIIRKKWVVLNPEEKVRQLWLHYLVFDKGYSKNLIQVEKGFVINGLTKRIDIALYNSDFTPYLLIECKASSVPLSMEVAEQILRYNQNYQCNKFVITNGNEHLGFEVVNQNIQKLLNI